DLSHHADATHGHDGSDAVGWREFTRRSSKQVTSSNITCIIEDAIDQNQVEVMTQLLSKKAGFLDLPSTTSLLRTEKFWVLQEALDRVARHASAEMMECVIAAAKQVKYKVKDRVGLLGLAIRTTNVPCTEVLLRHYPVVEEEVERTEYDSDNEDWRLRNAVVPNAAGNTLDMVTLFELAFAHGNAQIMELLVKAGARSVVRREHLVAIFKTPGHRRLITKDDQETRETLERMRPLKLSESTLQYGLQVAIQNSSAHYAQFCIDKGANADFRYNIPGSGKQRRERPTMLFLALEHGCAPIVKMLLEHGARITDDERARIDDSYEEDDGRMEGLRGLKRVEEYFSMDWEEIVQTYHRHG
ncbi:hypothetical protein C8A00DRAFT_18773, partial [Chaetomidium leptoderma]